MARLLPKSSSVRGVGKITFTTEGCKGSTASEENEVSIRIRSRRVQSRGWKWRAQWKGIKIWRGSGGTWERAGNV